MPSKVSNSEAGGVVVLGWKEIVKVSSKRAQSFRETVTQQRIVEAPEVLWAPNPINQSEN
jgi:hypothetical protein